MRIWRWWSEIKLLWESGMGLWPHGIVWNIPFDHTTPEGRLGRPDVSPCHLIPLYYLLSCSSAWSCYSFHLKLFCFLPAGPFSWTFSRKFFNIFHCKIGCFVWPYCLAARRSKLVSGMCSMLPYGNGICCYAFIYYFSFFLLLPSIPFFILFKNLILISRRNGPRYQRVLALYTFVTGAIPKGLILWTFCIWCLCMFSVDLCQDWFCGFWIISGLTTCAQSK